MSNYTLDLNSGELRHSDEELYHWGILGQKWGVRRYQNKDGSLTPEGRIRYNREMAKLDKKRLKAKKKENAMDERNARIKAKIEVQKAKQINKAKKKSILKTVILNKMEQKKADNKKDDKKESAAEKAATLTKKQNEKQNKKLKYEDFSDISNIVEKGEQRTHDGISRLYRDKYVLDGQKKLKARQFRKMSTEDLNNYINRYSAETRYLSEKEKRSGYDINARTLKRWTSRVGSAIILAIGVKTVSSILSKD